MVFLHAECVLSKHWSGDFAGIISHPAGSYIVASYNIEKSETLPTQQANNLSSTHISKRAGKMTPKGISTATASTSCLESNFVPF